ncbi:branched-chain amino acid permease [Candidatus Thioglobus autotrophicus]|uniref:Branched-chain amino acid permease n=1 Tax=Candidatus Thioglobus autotrophicus TaxID=1705394 RepID=A0A0M4PMT4_9GAMM|nr:AzlC family ABC transporter permease [Candidatus Thioglobus autotrophicus]ALE52367.1 branched-chain amino acid permease [Candidatus Thioglobus autotrophicus]WPE17925.1 AzlC family ABC transporter permease [Candidatus Thioglobus autotrophicus]
MNQQIFKSSLPVLFGYMPLGVAFGILFNDLGYAWYFATLMAVFVYAGAAQFMVIGLLAAGAGLFEIFIATFLLNSRHIFYGLSMLKKFGDWNLKKIYLAFGLTDETYSLVTTIESPHGIQPIDYYFSITALNHSYWVIGCTLGAWIGASIQINTQGMDFALTALFVVLLIEQWKKIKEPLPFIVAIFSSLLAIYFFSEQMLLLSIVLSIALLITIKLSQKDTYE